MFNDYVSNINLIDGMNIQTIPLEVSNELTTTKWLMAMEKKLNDIINIRNNMLQDSTKYIDDQISYVNNYIKQLENLLQSGNYLNAHSIDLDKLNFDLKNEVDSEVIDFLPQIAKIPMFYLDDDGYFCVDIPSSWTDIIFSSDTEGHLILEY